MHRRSYSGCDPPGLQRNLPSFSRTDWRRPNRGVSPLNRPVNSTPFYQRTPSLTRLQVHPSRGSSFLNLQGNLVPSRGVFPLNRPENLGPSRGVCPLNRPAHLAHPSQGLFPLKRPANWTPPKQNQVYGYRNLTSLTWSQDVQLPGRPEPLRERSRNWTTTKRRLQLTPQKQERVKAWYEEYERDSRLPHSNVKKQKSVHFSPSTLDSSEKRQQEIVRQRSYKNPRRRSPASRNITRSEPHAENESAFLVPSQKPAIDPYQSEGTGLTATVSLSKLVPANVSLPDTDSSSDSESSCSASSSNTSCSFSCSRSSSCSCSSSSDAESEDEAGVVRPVPVPGQSANPTSQSGASKQTTAAQDKTIINKSESTLVMASGPRPSFKAKKPVSCFEDDLIFGQMDLLTKAPHDIEATPNPADVSLGTFPVSETRSLTASVPSHTYPESMIFDIRHKPQKRALLPWYDEDMLDMDSDVVLPPPPPHPIFPYCFVDINQFLSPVMARLSLQELDMMHMGGGDAPQSSGSGAANARKRGVVDAMETDEARRTSDKMGDDNKRQKLELLDEAEKKQKDIKSILENIKAKVTTRTHQLQQWVKKKRQQLRRWRGSHTASSSSSCKKHQLARKAADDSGPCKKSKYC